MHNLQLSSFCMILIDSEYNSLLSLLSTVSPSSAEDDIANDIKDYCGDTCMFKRDSLGNIFLSLSDIGKRPIMIAAHSDEIGLQVINITSEGFIRFRPIGGVDLKATVGRHVYIISGNNRIPGVICKVPIHIEYKEKIDKQLEASDLWIDIGCENADEANRLVSIGDMIGFAPNTLCLGRTKLSAKALDNKLGVFIAATVMKRLSASPIKKDVTAVLTVQEEVGCKGATVATETLQPIYGICIDVGIATDCPGVSEDKYGSLVLGRGPALIYCTDTNRYLTDAAAKILEKSGIPFQKSVGIYPSGGTDTNKMQVAGNGIPCILVSIPLRSMHTPTEVCDLNDIAAAIDAVIAIVQKLTL